MEHLLRDRLLPLLERAEAHRLRRDLATRGPHLPDDLDVLFLNLLRERQALEEIIESARLEHDRDQVRSVALVEIDELVGEGRLASRLERLELRQALAGRIQLELKPDQLGTLGVEVRLDLRDSRLEGTDARVELGEAAEAALTCPDSPDTLLWPALICC